MKGKWCGSLYMTIDQRNLNKNKLCLKKLLFEVEKQLRDYGVKPCQLEVMLAPLASILQDTEFWKEKKDGFTAFFSDDFFVWFTLPDKFINRVIVKDRFHLKPLLEKIDPITSLLSFNIGENQFI